FAAALRVDVLAGEQLFHLFVRIARSRWTTTSYRRRPPLRSQTYIEIVPGILPLISSWLADVTTASATSALVRDTREIALPTSTIVERPTSSRTDETSSAKSTRGMATAIIRIKANLRMLTAPGARLRVRACHRE